MSLCDPINITAGIGDLINGDVVSTRIRPNPTEGEKIHVAIGHRRKQKFMCFSFSVGIRSVVCHSDQQLFRDWDWNFALPQQTPLLQSPHLHDWTWRWLALWWCDFSSHSSSKAFAGHCCHISIAVGFSTSLGITKRSN